MKVEVKEQKEQERKYPYLGKYKHGEFIVLFTKDSTGVVLKSGKGWDIGYNQDMWSEKTFEPLEGSITLSND